MGAKKSKPKAVPQKKSKKGASLVAGLLILCLVVGGFGFVYVNDQRSRASDQDLVASQREAIDACVTAISDTLNKVSGTATVYDAEGNKLFVLRETQGVTGVADVPEDLLIKLRLKMLNGASVSKIDLDAWSDSHTFVGGFTSDAEELLYFVSGSLGWVAVQLYANTTNLQFTDEGLFIVAAALDERFTTDELLSYCVSAAMYGNQLGLLSACEHMFGAELSALNEWQKEYLVYAFNNLGASWNDYSTNNVDSTGGATTAEEFGLTGAGDSYWLLRQEVKQELSSIVGQGLLTTDYNIRLKIKPSLQRDMQSALDTAMQSSIALGSTGQPIMDGAAMCIDSHTGYVVGIIGSRSISSISSELTFANSSMVGVYESARTLLEENEELTYVSLLSYDTLAGSEEWATFGSLVWHGQLSNIGVSPVVESVITLGEAADFITSLYVDVGPRFIEQVQSSDGELIYTAKAATDISLEGVNSDMRSLIMGATDSAMCDYSQYADQGCVFGTATSELIVVGIYGATAQGHTLGSSDYDMCVNAAVGVFDAALKHFPKEPASIDPGGVVAAKVVKAQEENAEFVSGLVDGWVEDLTAMEVTSVETREEFEHAYSHYVSALSTYYGVITDELVDELASKIDQVRIDRTDELMRYAS